MSFDSSATKFETSVWISSDLGFEAGLALFAVDKNMPSFASYLRHSSFLPFWFWIMMDPSLIFYWLWRFGLRLDILLGTMGEVFK